MRKHNGMRPQDIAILLKIIALEKPEWQLKELSNSLYLSISEISESLNRSRTAGLIDFKKKRVNRESLFEFLIHGVKYVFPQHPGSQIKGVPTAHSHEFFANHFSSNSHYVWPYPKGSKLGFAIEPFYKSQAQAALLDPVFYKLLALVDVLRVGKLREIDVASQELKKMLRI